MIHGTSVFSIADLNMYSGHLYGKYKFGKNIFDVELLLEHEDEGTTEVRVMQTKEECFVKTSKLFDVIHSEEKLW